MNAYYGVLSVLDSRRYESIKSHNNYQHNNDKTVKDVVHGKTNIPRITNRVSRVDESKESTEVHGKYDIIGSTEIVNHSTVGHTVAPTFSDMYVSADLQHTSELAQSTYVNNWPFLKGNFDYSVAHYNNFDSLDLYIPETDQEIDYYHTQPPRSELNFQGQSTVIIYPLDDQHYNPPEKIQETPLAIQHSNDSPELNQQACENMNYLQFIYPFSIDTADTNFESYFDQNALTTYNFPQEFQAGMDELSLPPSDTEPNPLELCFVAEDEVLTSSENNIEQDKVMYDMIGIHGIMN